MAAINNNKANLEAVEANPSNIFANPCIVRTGDAGIDALAPTMISKPEAGESLDVFVQPGQNYFFNFPESDVANMVRQGNDIMITFADGSEIKIIDFQAATIAELPAVFAFSNTLNGSEIEQTPVEQTAETTPADEPPQETADFQTPDLGAIEPAAGEDDIASEVASAFEADGDPQDLAEVALELAQVEPAAGEEGGDGGQEDAGGFGFQSSFTPVGVIPLNDIGPIDPTALAFALPEFDDETLFIDEDDPAAPVDDTPQLRTPTPQSLDETNLISFTAPTAITVSDTIVVDFGVDAPGTITFDGSFVESGSLLNGDLTSTGLDVIVTQETNRIVGRRDSNLNEEVFEITIDPNTGAYAFTQFLQLDHADSSDPDDLITFTIGVVATDADGDQASDSIVINIADDAPPVLADTDAIDESDNAPGVTNAVSGTITNDFGADGPAQLNGILPTRADSFEATGSVETGTLRSDGDEVNVTLVGDTYTGTADGRDIFTLQIDTAGNYTFTLLDVLDHADPSDPNDIINLSFGVQITDFDGDTTEGTLTVDVLDDGPSFITNTITAATTFSTFSSFAFLAAPTAANIAATALTNPSGADIDESGLFINDQVLTGTFDVDFGNDVPGTIVGNDTFTSTGSRLNDALTSGGDAITVTFDDSNGTGGTYTGTTVNGGVTVFVLTFDDINEGDHTFTLSQPLDHADGADADDVITLNFGVTATDSDGDFVNGSLAITVADDAAIANDDVNGAEEDQAITGSFIANDDLSEDVANTVTNINFNGTDFEVPAGGSSDPIAGTFGTLIANSDGTYTYTANSNDPDGTDVFTYTLTDADGDTDTAQLSVIVTPDGQPVSVGGLITTDETDLTPGPATTTGTAVVDFGLDGTGTITPNGKDSFSGSALNNALTSGGVPVEIAVNTAGDGYVGTAGGVTVFTLTITDPVTGDFEFVLEQRLDHADGTDPNDTINLEFGVTATDLNGDTVDGLINVLVVDDAPVAIDDADTVEEGRTVPGNVLDNDEASEDIPTLLVEVTFNGVSTDVPAAGATIVGDFGTLTIGQDGEYEYEATGGDGIDTFEYVIEDFDGDQETADLVITVTPDDVPIVTQPITEIADEADIPDEQTGTVTVDFGDDDPGTVVPCDDEFTFAGSALSQNDNLLSGGEEVEVTLNGTVFTGVANGETIFTLDVQPDGSYTFNLEGTLDHADAADPSDVITLNFGIKAIDSEGDETEATISVDVIDDAPVAEDDTDSGEEGTQLTGNVITNDDSGADEPATVTAVNGQPVPDEGLSVTGNFGILFINPDGSYTYNALTDGVDTFTYTLTDADGDSDTADLVITVTPDDVPEVIESGFEVVDETDLPVGVVRTGQIEIDFGTDSVGATIVPNGDDSFRGSALNDTLTSNGNPVTVALSGTTYTGTADGQPVFTLDVQNDGSYTFELLGTLDHADPDDPNDIIVLEFGVTATDGDGDSVETSVIVNVLDDVPTIGDAAGDVDETNFNNGDLTTSNTLFTDFGTEVGSITPGGNFEATVNGTPIALTSGGLGITVTQTADGYTGTTTNSNNVTTTIFTLVIDPDTGRFDYTQSLPLDHPDGSDANDIIDLNFSAAIVSTDGDTDTGTITVSVADDGVTANDDLNGAEEGQFITGTVIPNDNVSEDTPNAITNIQFNGTDSAIAAGGSATITTTLGVLTMNSDGTYTFQATDAGDPDGDVVFTYTLTDADGDTDTAELTISVTPDGEPITVGGALTTDETALTPGPSETSGVVDVDFGLDGGGTIDPSDEFLACDVFGEDITSTLSSGGELVTVTRTTTGYTGTVASGPVFTLTIDPDTGAFDFVLQQRLDHADATDPNDTITLKFGITATDSDGDTLNGTIDVLVVDDAPVALDDTDTGEEGTTITGNVLDNDEASEDNPTTLVQIVFNGVTFDVPDTGATIDGDFGTLTIQPDGTYSYAATTAGVDTFEYVIEDFDGDQETAELQITVEPDSVPVAVNDIRTVNDGNSVSGNLIANDTVGNDTPGAITHITFGVTTTTIPTGGTVTVIGNSGVLTVSANGAYNYVSNENDVAVQETDSFWYALSDSDGDIATAQLSITVRDDDVPIARNDVASVNDGERVTGSLVSNDSFGADSPGSIVTAGTFDGSFGTLTINANGTYSYTAREGVVATSALDRFNYTIEDSDGDQDTATLSITVNDNDAPVAVDDRITQANFVSGNTFRGNVTSNDNFGADGSGSPAVVFNVGFYSFTGGTLRLNADGSYVFTIDRSVQTTHNYELAYQIQDSDGDRATGILRWTITPLALDLDGDGLELTTVQDGVLFDYDTDGELEQTAWVESDDGFLVMDRNEDGIINDRGEMFGDLYGYSDGFSHLGSLDSNGDNVITSADAQWSLLQVWRDLDQDGETDEGELYGLDDLGISNINLDAALTDFEVEGNYISHVSSYTTVEGETREIVDAHLNYDELTQEGRDAMDLSNYLVEESDVDAAILDFVHNTEGDENDALVSNDNMIEYTADTSVMNAFEAAHYVPFDAMNTADQIAV